MPRQLLNEYLTPSEFTITELARAVDETTPKQRRILQFAELVEHATRRVEFEVLIEQLNQVANIVGFSDSSIMTKGARFETRMISPFHIKNLYPFKATDEDGMVIRQGEGYAIDRSGLAYSTQDLEEKRLNLIRWAIMAMLNDKNFTYVDGKLKISVPYTRDILNLTDPSTKWDDAAFDLLDEIYRVKQEFYANFGQLPNIAFMNGAMGRVLVKDKTARAAYVAAQSSDPENSSQMWDAFNYSGINWNILHDPYPTLDGTLKQPVDDARIIFGVTNHNLGPDGEPVGGPESGLPVKIHRCSNILNANDASRPFYDFLPISEDPWQGAVRMYDNIIPSVMKRGVFQHLNNCLT